MLPQSQNGNLQPPKSTSIPAPSTRLKYISQPLRVQTQELAPTPPPREQHSKPPRLDPPSNTWIKRFKKYKKTPQILKARKTQVAPQQV